VDVPADQAPDSFYALHADIRVCVLDNPVVAPDQSADVIPSRHASAFQSHIGDGTRGVRVSEKTRVIRETRHPDGKSMDHMTAAIKRACEGSRMRRADGAKTATAAVVAIPSPVRSAARVDVAGERE